jgi:hypothetical protein
VKEYFTDVGKGSTTLRSGGEYIIEASRKDMNWGWYTVPKDFRVEDHSCLNG